MRMIMFFLLTVFILCLSVPGQSESAYSVSVPVIPVEALTGSCVLIPCTFNIPNFEEIIKKTKSPNVMWMTGIHKSSRIFDSKDNMTKDFERIEILGSIYSRNCTTVFYNVLKKHQRQYYFRIESDFTATFLNSPFELTVKDSPGPPQVSELSEVSEGTAVTLTCTAAAPCPSQPPNITWSLPIGNTHSLIQDEKHGNRSLTSFLTFNATRSHHGRNISCMASYLRHKSTEKINSRVQTLTIQFSPAVVDVSVRPSGPVAEGNSVTLTCNCSEANPPVQNYTWFKRGQNSAIGSGQTLTFNLSSSDEGPYYCRAEHPQGTKDSAAVELMTIKDQIGSLMLIAGGCLGGLLPCVLIIFALRRKVSKVAQKHSQCSQSQGCGECDDKDEPVYANNIKTTDTQCEEIHYGEIDFSKPALRDPSEWARENKEQGEDPEYTEVRRFSRHAQDRHQTDQDTDELYAQVI